MTNALIRLAGLYADHMHLAVSTVSLRAARHGGLIAALASGDRNITVRRARRILQWFSDHWPTDLEWPADIPRPDPSPDSPAAQAASISAPISVSTPETEMGDPLAAVEAALERQGAAMDREDWDAARAAGAEALAAGGVLGDDGQIACPEALCRALHVTRSVYQRVISLYADGSPREHEWPRRLARSPLGLPRQTQSEQMLDALVAAGDARFRSRVERAAQRAELAQRLGLGMSAP